MAKWIIDIDYVLKFAFARTGMWSVKTDIYTEDVTRSAIQCFGDSILCYSSLCVLGILGRVVCGDTVHGWFGYWEIFPT